jgi:hypothetical protein
MSPSQETSVAKRSDEQQLASANQAQRQRITEEHEYEANASAQVYVHSVSAPL